MSLLRMSKSQGCRSPAQSDEWPFPSSRNKHLQWKKDPTLAPKKNRRRQRERLRKTKKVCMERTFEVLTQQQNLMLLLQLLAILLKLPVNSVWTLFRWAIHLRYEAAHSLCSLQRILLRDRRGCLKNFTRISKCSCLCKWCEQRAFVGDKWPYYSFRLLAPRFIGPGNFWDLSSEFNSRNENHLFLDSTFPRLPPWRYATGQDTPPLSCCLVW